MQSMENMHRSVGAVKLEQVVVSWTHCAPLQAMFHLRRHRPQVPKETALIASLESSQAGIKGPQTAYRTWADTLNSASMR